MMKGITLITILCMTAAFASCGSGRLYEKITVASKYGSRGGGFVPNPLLVKHGRSLQWKYIYSGIEGFDYNPGYEYVIQVKRELIDGKAVDSPEFKYSLVKIISKTEKESFYIPETKTVKH